METQSSLPVQSEIPDIGSAVAQGVTDAAADVGKRVDDINRVVSKAVYNTFYYTSYYVTFCALTVGKLIPWDNAMGNGLHDGAIAASNAVKKADEQKTQGYSHTNIEIPATAAIGSVVA